MDKMIGMFLWSMLQNKLQQMWINTQWVNFQDMNSINDFAKKILPWMLKDNPQMQEYIKNNVPQEKKEEVVKIINNL